MEGAGALDVAQTAVPTAGAAAGEFGGGDLPQNVTPETQGHEGASPEATPEPEFQFELPSGSKYRTLEELQRGATEKDFTIARMKAELAEFRASQAQQQVPQAPPVDPQAQAQAEINALAEELYRDLRAEFPNDAPQDIEAEARVQAKLLYKQQQYLRNQLEEQQRQQQVAKQQAEMRAFVDANWNELNSEVGQRVFQQARAEGREFRTPQEHLNAVHAELYRLGQGGQPQAGSMTGVQGAVQHQQRPLFGSPAGTGNTAPALPAHVQASLDQAARMGITDPQQLEVIKQEAMRVVHNQAGGPGNRRRIL